jgi:hypothetical protein
MAYVRLQDLAASHRHAYAGRRDQGCLIGLPAPTTPQFSTGLLLVVVRTSRCLSSPCIARVSSVGLQVEPGEPYEDKLGHRYSQTHWPQACSLRSCWATQRKRTDPDHTSKEKCSPSGHWSLRYASKKSCWLTSQHQPEALIERRRDPG